MANPLDFSTGINKGERWPTNFLPPTVLPGGGWAR